MLTNERIDELVKPEIGRVNAHIYTDPDIFQEEMTRIFSKAWVYVGHVSEVPEPGDYKTTYIGQVPVILTRDEDGDLNVLVNRCIHRGTTVCQTDYGNSTFFRCEYHGWMYRNTGDLTGVTLREGFKPGEFDGVPSGLDKVGAVDNYRGLIWARLSARGPSLREYMGGTTQYIDDWMDTSPSGEFEVKGGVWKHTYEGNWKIGLEGSDERYHVTFLHQVARVLAQRHMNGAAWNMMPKDLTYLKSLDFGNGHGVVEINSDQFPSMRQTFPPEYVDALVKRLGQERTTQVLQRVNRMHIFPNVAFGPENIRVFRPIAPNLTEVTQYMVKFAEVPGVTENINRLRIKTEQNGYGPAGYIGPDDLEIFPRMQEGYRAMTFEGNSPYVWFSRGVTTPRRGPSGEHIGEDMSEVAQSAVYRGWHKLMKTDSGVPAGGPSDQGNAS